MLPDVYYESRSFLKGKNMYVWCEPEILDFAAKKNYTLHVSTDTHLISLPFSDENTKEFFSFFNDLSQHNPIVFGWNYKNLNSYFLGKVGKRLEFSKVYDLKIIESFHGENKDKPQNFEEAKRRLAATPNFSKYKKLWQEIYWPLIDEVVPAIENTPLTDVDKRKMVYPYYEIEGQINGRMKCNGALTAGYNPHSLTVQVKNALKPTGYEDNFVYFDYKSMEVLVLQWLSNDWGLKEIINSDQDMYVGIWEKITGIACDESKRKICKDLFLPVVFGQGYKTTAQNFNFSENTAKRLIDNIYSSFPNALEYVHKKTVKGQALDYFGRIRKFEDENSFKIRNFLIQSPAAVICLHKLVKLYNKIKNISKICYHLHDGFCILVNNQNLKQVIALGQQSLTEDSDLYPGLRLKVAVKTSKKLIDI